MHSSFIDILYGVVIGFLVSLPVGPVALITMKRTAEFGLRAGIVAGLAIVVIDTTAAVAILLGLHHSFHYLRPLPSWFHIAGAAIIFFYGLRMVYTDPVHAIADELPWQKHFFGSIMIALSNPSTYFSFGAIGLLVSRFIHQSTFTRVSVGIGFFVGAFLWWCTLALIATTQRDRYRSARNIHHAIGVAIMFLAILIVLPIHTPHFLHFLSR
ncbi:MAG TPA: LysE family transporter [Candidatus Paceibacterota bacterium]|jgi:threonine/homoserine/homoserine lactone efflux protein|nr:LysE family transporter [Candidatus Paceibacterota bacterium]